MFTAAHAQLGHLPSTNRNCPLCVQEIKADQWRKVLHAGLHINEGAVGTHAENLE